jgi:hypothetical protein
VVAEVVAYASDILPAVVSTMGEEAVPVMKPFCDMTGPENVVFAMMCPYMQVRRICLHVVSRDCQIHRKARNGCNIHHLNAVNKSLNTKKGAEAPFP